MDYQVKSIAKQCVETGEALQPGDVCFSALVERFGQLQRLDYSEKGWKGPPEGTLGYWRNRVAETTTGPKRTLDADTVMAYFEQLSDNGNPQEEKFRYIMALLLLQKRRLRIEASRFEGEVELLQLWGTRGDGPYEIRNQQLAPDEIDQLQAELNAKLAEEWT
jgi:hypothetical protein